MRNNKTHSLRNLLAKNRQAQNKHFKAQFKAFNRYLKTHIATASMVADATGIPHKNITRYKRKLEKAGQLIEVERRLCQVTGFGAWYLSTNPELINYINKSSNTDKI
jgi:HEPN domain-containing protein